MPKVRHMYPGGNTCEGFYSYYGFMAPAHCEKKIVIKGGPGVGKSTFMKEAGKSFSSNGFEVEYHWCSSDNDSLDGLVVANGRFCMVDGTAPHIVDPRFPGAVDFIINLGDYWDAALISAHKPEIVSLTNRISFQFERAYNRLLEAKCSFREWSSYYNEAINTTAQNKNILALTSEFVQPSSKTDRRCRHLFAAALTPKGMVTQVDSLIEKNWAVFAVKGSPGVGVNHFLSYVEKQLELNGVYGEIFHNPFDPFAIDMIIVPANHSVMVDISGHVVDYMANLKDYKFKRMLDFDQFLDPNQVAAYSAQITAASQRFASSLDAAVAFIAHAKELHDELETFYVPAMDFAAIESLRTSIVQGVIEELKG